MSKLKAFGYIYYRSLTSTKYYSEILKTKFSFSFKYFVTLAALASVIITVAASIELIPQMQKGLDEIIGKARDAYPADLVFTTNSDGWAINQQEPYVIGLPVDPETWVPEDAKEEMMEQTGQEPFMPENLIVFDHEGEIGDLEEMDTLILVNDANILIRDAQKIEAYPLGELPESEFTRDTFLAAMDGFASFARYLPGLVIALLFFVSFFFYFVIRMVALLIVACVLWFVGFVGGSKVNFTNAYRIGIHTMTLPLTIQILLTVLRVPLYVPLWFFVVNVVFGAVVVFSLNKSTDIQAPEASN